MVRRWEVDVLREGDIFVTRFDHDSFLYKGVRPTGLYNIGHGQVCLVLRASKVEREFQYLTLLLPDGKVIRTGFSRSTAEDDIDILVR